MSMTVQDLRDYVRVSLDVDEEELPDTLVDAWGQEAQARVILAIPSWHALQANYTLVCTPAVQAYDFTTFSVPDTVAEVLGVEDDNRILQPMSHNRAVERFVNLSTGRPYVFSIYGDLLYLWPSPGEARTYQIRALREAQIVFGPADTPDSPPEFHSLIGEYMLARAYEQQDDEIMSQQKFARFEQTLGMLAKNTNRSERAGVRALGRTQISNTFPGFPGRNWYDWE